MAVVVNPEQTRRAGFNAGLDRAIKLLASRRTTLYSAGQNLVSIELEVAIKELETAKLP